MVSLPQSDYGSEREWKVQPIPFPDVPCDGRCEVRTDRPASHERPRLVTLAADTLVYCPLLMTLHCLGSGLSESEEHHLRS